MGQFPPDLRLTKAKRIPGDKISHAGIKIISLGFYGGRGFQKGVALDLLVFRGMLFLVMRDF